METQVEVKQNGCKDCGPSCLLSIIRYYGGDISHEELSLILKTDNNGTTAYNMIYGAKELGFDGYGIKYSYEEITENNILFPIITHVLINNMYHYIVIYKVDTDKKKLYVMDPSIGNTKISFDIFKSIYLGTSIVLYPVKKIPALNRIKNIGNYLSDYIYSERRNLIVFYLLSITVVLLSILTSCYLKIIIDRILPDYFYNEFIIVSYLFLNIVLIKCLISYLRGRYLIKITYNIGIRLNNETIRHIFNLPYQFFKNKSTGEVISRVSDIKNLKDIVSDIIVNLSIDITLILFSMIILLLINYKMFLIILVFMFLYYLTVLLYSGKLKNEINNFQISGGEYNRKLTESIEGYETNRNINMINYVCKLIETKYIIHSKKYMKFHNTMNNQLYIKDLLMNICYIMTVFTGTQYINSGVITLGSFIVFNSLLSYFTEPIKNILDLWPNLSYIKNIYSRINDLLIMKSETINESDIKINGDIVFDNISYSYNNMNYAVENVNFSIRYGSRFLIYGKSGGGKSTIVKLLLKYNKDYKGKITINDKNLLDIDDSVIASSFSYVSQNDYLNNDTLKNNIVYGREIKNNEYETVVNICHVNEIRDSKILRDNFMIEDNGFNISGGERQKIILARTLLKESNYIILDEALSEVEFKEEKEILKKIMNYYKGKTIIYISHKKEIIDLFSNKYYLERRKA